MGRIKTVLIKRMAKALLQKYPAKFTLDFEENKKNVNDLLIVNSKRIKDQVAGLITVMKKQGR